ncbi:MAG: L-threonylcarbamoyladenylate synthase [Candidatus Parcubacteria bacterium]|nr:L-threonylcarbamoyladenylate synthase [Candidatus Parcubacteria bacterium]
METMLLTPENLQSTVDATVKIIKEGGVIIAPTDTVYGLLADATNEEAIQKIYNIKNRPEKKSLPIFVRDITMVKELAVISQEQQSYLEKNWPGKVTTILERKNNINIFGVEYKTIALRIPSYPFINLLLERINLPLSGTSANISGSPSSTKIDEILKQFENKEMQPDLIINAGNLEESQPSTIVDLTQADIKIVRP